MVAPALPQPVNATRVFQGPRRFTSPSESALRTRPASFIAAKRPKGVRQCSVNNANRGAVTGGIGASREMAPGPFSTLLIRDRLRPVWLLRQSRAGHASKVLTLWRGPPGRTTALACPQGPLDTGSRREASCSSLQLGPGLRRSSGQGHSPGLVTHSLAIVAHLAGCEARRVPVAHAFVYHPDHWVSRPVLQSAPAASS